MSFFFEPCTCDSSSDVLIFLILLSESSIMKECSKLDIFEVVSLDSLSHSEIRRPSEYTRCMCRIVIGVLGALLEECTCIFVSLFDDGRHSIYMVMRLGVKWIEGLKVGNIQNFLFFVILEFIVSLFSFSCKNANFFYNPAN